MTSANPIDALHRTYPKVTARKAKLKQKILAECLDLFAEKGIDGTPMSEILARAKTSAGAFYGVFDSKDDLVATLVQEAVDPVANAIDSEAKKFNNPVANLALGLKTTLNIALAKPTWGAFVSQTAMFSMAREEGFGPRIMRDIRMAAGNGDMTLANDLAAFALYFGAFQAGVALARDGLLNAAIVTIIVERTLVAMGAVESVARELAKVDWGGVQIHSELGIGALLQTTSQE